MPYKNILANAPLFYPTAKSWMWNYCIYLGPFTNSNGKNFDLGIYLDEDGSYSAAIVYGNKPGEYYSGDLNLQRNSVLPYSEMYIETLRRAKELGLINSIPKHEVKVVIQPKSPLKGRFIID